MQRNYVIGNLDRIEEIDEELEELENHTYDEEEWGQIEDLRDERASLIEGICEELHS